MGRPKDERVRTIVLENLRSAKEIRRLLHACEKDATRSHTFNVSLGQTHKENVAKIYEIVSACVGALRRELTAGAAGDSAH